jgi:16S rRNA G1207 methylase RsmC
VPGREMVKHLDLTGRKRLIDVGGGPGTYAMLLARKHPELHAVVMDLPNVVTIADELIHAWHLQDRVSVQAGDYFTDPLGSGYDVVLISNTLHQEDPEIARAILRKARAALVPGGLLVVHAAFLREGGARHIWAALQTIHLNVHYEGGRNYTITDTVAMIRETGFQDPVVKRMSLLNPNSLILATAP